MLTCFIRPQSKLTRYGLTRTSQILTRLYIVVIFTVNDRQGQSFSVREHFRASNSMYDN